MSEAAMPISGRDARLFVRALDDALVNDSGWSRPRATNSITVSVVDVGEWIRELRSREGC